MTKADLVNAMAEKAGLSKTDAEGALKAFTSAVTDALKAVKVARGMGKEITGIIVTRHKDAKYEMPLSSIKSMLEAQIIGVIPEDDAVKEALNRRDAVIHTHPKSKVSRKYQQIARKLTGEEEEEVRGFFRKLLGI